MHRQIGLVFYLAIRIQAIFREIFLIFIHNISASFLLPFVKKTFLRKMRKELIFKLLYPMWQDILNYDFYSIKSSKFEISKFYTISDRKGLEIRKFEFAAKTQFLSRKSLLNTKKSFREISPLFRSQKPWVTRMEVSQISILGLKYPKKIFSIIARSPDTVGQKGSDGTVK